MRLTADERKTYLQIVNDTPAHNAAVKCFTAYSALAASGEEVDQNASSRARDAMIVYLYASMRVMVDDMEILRGQVTQLTVAQHRKEKADGDAENHQD